MNKKELCMFRYKYHNGLLPSVFDSLFTNLGRSHSYNTRNAFNYHFRIRKMKCAISDGPKIWSGMPNEFKTCKHIDQFKKKMTNICRNNSVAFGM